MRSLEGQFQKDPSLVRYRGRAATEISVSQRILKTDPGASLLDPEGAPILKRKITRHFQEGQLKSV